MRQFTPKELKAFSKNLPKRTKEVVILLENIEDLHTLKSISEIALANGVAKIYTTGTTKELPKASNSQNIIKEKNSYFVLQNLRKENFINIAVQLTTNALPLENLKVLANANDKICLVFGNKINGISNDTLKNCDESIYIPIYAKNILLSQEINVAIALYNI